MAGVQVARGYVGRPGLTSERFVACPFGAPGERMYRTGDRARWTTDGRLVFAGRADEQVKIRGYRVEPGEVQAVLATHPLVAHAVVVAREDTPGDVRLVAYIVTDETDDTDAAELSETVRESVASRLPDYMVPSAVVVLPELPLTGNGKLDRKALPTPEYAAATTAGTGRPPATVQEEILCQAFAQVLGLPAVGVDDDFFTLGGHSLLAVSLVEQLRSRGVSISVRALFQTPTPAGLAEVSAPDAIDVPENRIPHGAEHITPDMLPLVELSEAELEHVVGRIPGGAANIADVYPLAPLQEGILFHHLVADQESGDVYVLPIVLELESRERLDAFLGALQRVVNRHDIYRTAILWRDLREPVQVVLREVELPVEEFVADPEGDDTVRQLLAHAGGRMDLSSAPLIRAHTAARPGGDRWVCLIRIHQTVRDHTSQEALLRELGAFLSGRGDTLPEALPFREFVAQARLGVPREEHERYFSDLLGDVEETTAPYGLLDIHGDGTDADRARWSVDEELAGRVRETARSLGVSPATVFHLAWARVLATVSGREDVVFGTVLFGRMNAGAGADRVQGPFINTLPVRVRVGSSKVSDVLLGLRDQLAELLVHEHAPLALAQRAGGVPGGSPLFTSIFNYRHHQAAARAAEQGSGTMPDGVSLLLTRERTNYPVAVAVDDLGTGFALTVDAVASVDADALCSMLHTTVGNLVTALEEAPDTRFVAVEAVPALELRRVLTEWNDTDAPVDAVTAPELFEAQAARTPDAVAVVAGTTEVSYAELDTRANRLAHLLRDHGVGPESVVGLCLPRGVEAIAAILGVWKAGAAYLPLDPEYPGERLAFMLADSGAGVVVGRSDLTGRFPASRIRVLNLDDPGAAAAVETAPVTAPRVAGTPDRMAYVIYTSGSTGRSKGVAVSHAGLANLAAAQTDRFAVDGSSRLLQFASMSFDAAVSDVVVALSSGACLVVAGADELLPGPGLARVLSRHAVTHVTLPPAVLAEMAPEDLAPVTTLVSAGEALGRELVGRWAPGRRFVNAYGPTETTVCATMSRPLAVGDAPDIGGPISGVRAYVLDDRLAPVPVGVAGELYVAGSSLARGYVGRPDLTAERFVASPYTGPGQRMYRTGDRVRWTADGRLVFAGRADAQVKIRGFRVEPEEVASVLTGHPALARAAVTVRADASGEGRLVAYVVPGGDRSDADDVALGRTVRDHVAQALPQYMVPSAVVVLDALPLTANGKLDRAALPEPDVAASAGAGREPATEQERILCEAFARVLGLPTVGVDDDFFALGGHSLLATRLVSRVRTVLGEELPIRTVFTSPTPAALAGWLADQGDRRPKARPALRRMRRPDGV
ncbi:amino acid adenylation domain-containing protein [Streptomyces sp. NPDC086080]|uniref:amino acid adenylation domain-containing protein n=1 Tax=Streptomyces sp. NPDC086080 TaxID=3365748 RepID=UPI0037D52A9E